MTSAVIYRIEHKIDRLGPYPGKSSFEDARLGFNFNHEDMNHPAPWEDTEEVYLFLQKHRAKEYVCGFPTRNSAYKWFAGHFKQLKENDFVLALYLAPQGTYALGHQALFTRQRATRLTQEELDPFVIKDKENNV